jgi:putative ABC transport system permease protein
MASTIIQIGRLPAVRLLNITISSVDDISGESKLFFAFVIIFGILITGLYPAWLSSRNNPRSLLGSNYAVSRFLPSLLTTIQYAAGIILIFCGLVIHRQLNYIFDRNLGFEKENIYMINAPVIHGATFDSDLNYFNEVVRKKNNVSGTSLSSEFVDVRLSAHREGGKFIYVDGLGVSDNYFSFFKIRLLAGRFFKPDERSGSIILSQIAAERLGHKNPADAIGVHLYFNGKNNEPLQAEVIGVIADFRVRPFFKTASNTEGQQGRGFCFVHGEFPYAQVAVRIEADDKMESLLAMEDAFSEVFPGNPFEGNFLADMVHMPYRHETATRNQVTFFTVVAIFIACLGLLAMISNKVEEKTREIGIRKALGATIGEIASVLLGTTFLQVLASIVIGIPLAWYFATEYLERYSERIEITVVYFALPAVLLWSILFATVATLVLNAMNTNPADTLRHE